MTKALFFLAINGFLSYLFVCITMIYGWGIEPKSWTWIIFGYALSYSFWPITVLIRKKLLEALDDND